MRLFYLFFLATITIINISGGVKSEIRWAVYILIFLLLNRRHYSHAAVISALSILAFIKAIKDFSAYDYFTFAAFIAMAAVSYAAGLRKEEPQDQTDHYLDSYNLETGRDIKDFGAIAYNLLSNLLDIYFLLFKPFSILFFLKEASDERFYKLTLFSSMNKEAINQDCIINIKEGALGMAAQKKDFFVFTVKDFLLPYYKRDTGVKTVVTMPVILNKVIGLIVVDFQEESGHARVDMRPELEKLINEIASVLSLFEINRKAISNERRVSFLYDVDAKLNLMEGPHKLSQIFFSEIKRLDICGGYIARLLPEDKAFEIIEVFNYPESIKKEKLVVKDDEMLRYIYYTGKSVVIKDAQNKNIRINFGKQNVSKFLLSRLGTNESLYGFMKLDKEEDFDFTEFEIKTLEMILYRITIILENAGLYEKIKKQATEDGLTGIFNHLTFQEKLMESVEKIKSGGLRRVALCLIDIDFFKKFNDDFGHQEGDRVLVRVAGMLKDFEKKYPGLYVARYGGEEFVVVMENHDIYEASRIAEEIRKHSEEHLSGGNPKETRKIYISCGVAACPDYAKDTRELIKNADEALYTAKEQGRNRVKNIMEARKT